MEQAIGHQTEVAPAIAIQPEVAPAAVIAHEPETTPTPRTAIDPLSRIGMGLVGIGVITDLGVHALQFLYGCALENALWAAVGASPSSVVECVIKEPVRWMPAMLQHILK